MMDVRPIRSEADYEWAVGEVARYFEHEPAVGTSEADRFDVLATLIEAYEAKHHSIPRSDPIDVLRFAIDDMGRSQTELADLLGSKSRASEILNRRRPLTLEMIRIISEAWKIPTGALTGQSMLKRDKGSPRRAAAGSPKAA